MGSFYRKEASEKWTTEKGSLGNLDIHYTCAISKKYFKEFKITLPGIKVNKIGS